MGFIARLFMALAAPITALFVTYDATNFGVVQLIVAILLFTGLAAALAFVPGPRKPAPTKQP